MCKSKTKILQFKKYIYICFISDFVIVFIFQTELMYHIIVQILDKIMLLRGKSFKIKDFFILWNKWLSQNVRFEYTPICMTNISYYTKEPTKNKTFISKNHIIVYSLFWLLQNGRLNMRSLRMEVNITKFNISPFLFSATMTVFR